jgi:hypothetical protein
MRYGTNVEETRYIIRAFLASPGDLAPERLAVKSAVDEMNSLLCNGLGFHVELVGWEDTVSQFGRPQAIINRELERCEVFIGLMWKKWGTPPDSSGDYSSGFEEEFRLSIDRRTSSGSPYISLFFKTIDSALESDPGDELKKVLSFRDEIISRRVVLFQKFDNIPGLERRIRRLISAYVQEKHQTRPAPEEDRSPSPNKSESTDDVQDTAEVTRDEAAAVFLERVAREARSTEGLSNLSHLETARVRLIGKSLPSQDDDDLPLGVHDANLIFRSTVNSELSTLEVEGLVRSGLHYYSTKTVPLWRWLVSDASLDLEELATLTTTGTAHSRAGAIAALAALDEDISDIAFPGKEGLLDNWLSDTSSVVKSAALDYLKTFGVIDDLRRLDPVITGTDYSVRQKGVEAAFNIRARGTPEKALEYALSNATLDIPLSVVRLLEPALPALPEATLHQALGHVSSHLRLIVLNELERRGAATEKLLMAMLSDRSAAIRHRALELREQGGSTITEKEAERILIRRRSSGAAAFIGQEESGDRHFEQHRFQKVLHFGREQLEKEAEGYSVTANDAFLALAHRYYSEYRDELLRAINDRFRSRLVDQNQRRELVFGPDSGTTLSTDLIEFVGDKLTERAADIILENAGPDQIDNVRHLMVSYANLSLLKTANYIRHFGSIEDIEALDKLYRAKRGSGLAWAVFKDSMAVARVIRGLAGSDLQGIDILKLHEDLASAVIHEWPLRSFGKISVDKLKSFLNHESDDIRSAASMRSVEANTQKKLGSVLIDYLSQSGYFYNVVHWLDCGISLKVKQAKKVVHYARLAKYNFEV